MSVVARFAPKGLPRAYWWLWTASLVNRLGNFVVPFLALYLTDARRLPVERVGWIVGCWGLGAIGSGPLGGALADRIGRRRTILVALVGGAAAMLQLAFARDLSHVAASTFVCGLVGEMHMPATSAIIVDTVPEERRSEAFGFLYWVANVGFAVSMSLAGFVAHAGFVWLFVGDAVTTLLCAFVIAATIRDTRPSTPPPKERTRFFAPYRDRRFVALVALSLALSLVFFQGGSSFPIDLRAHGIAPEWFGLLMALNGVLIVAVQPIVTRRLAGVGPSKVLAAGALLYGLGFGAYAFARTVPAYAAAVIVWTSGEIVISPIMPTVLGAMAPEDLRGSYQGGLQLAYGVGAFVAPVVGAAILARASSHALWGACFVVGALVALGHLVWSPAHPKG